MGYQERGVFWYGEADAFLKSLMEMTTIEIGVRRNTVWEDQWSRALIRHYLSRKEDDNESTMDWKLKMMITRSRHRLRVEKRTTFGMIRKILGRHYSIKPEHIDIWLPDPQTSETKWNYETGGRGRWNRKLGDFIKARTEWMDLCPLRFEIQPYNVNDFDKMTEYHT